MLIEQYIQIIRDVTRMKGLKSKVTIKNNLYNYYNMFSHIHTHNVISVIENVYI